LQHGQFSALSPSSSFRDPESHANALKGDDLVVVIYRVSFTKALRTASVRTPQPAQGVFPLRKLTYNNG
jgi:hypothetical protein